MNGKEKSKKVSTYGIFLCILDLKSKYELGQLIKLLFICSVLICL